MSKFGNVDRVDSFGYRGNSYMGSIDPRQLFMPMYAIDARQWELIDGVDKLS